MPDSQKKLRIGMVCPYSFDEPGGVQAHILDLAKIFNSQGHDVRVIGPAKEETELPDFVVKGGRSISVPYNGSVARLSLGPQVNRRIRQFIEEGQFDVLHIHEPNSPSYSMTALALAEGPIVATYHASANESRLLKMAVPGLRPLLEKVRGGIAVSEMARRWQVEQLGGDPVLIPNGVDTKAFAAHSQEASTRSVPHIAFLGRLDEPRKGFKILLDALDMLPMPYRVSVIGSGEHIPHRDVTYVGRVSDQEKAEILGSADIYVAPNTGGESFGIVLVEAMAARCAVIASDLEAFAAVCDANSDQPAGMLFRNGDAKSLADVLGTVLNDASLRQELISAGSKRAELYDWSRVSAEIMRVYQTVADGTKVRVE